MRAQACSCGRRRSWHCTWITRVHLSAYTLAGNYSGIWSAHGRQFSGFRSGFRSAYGRQYLVGSGVLTCHDDIFASHVTDGRGTEASGRRVLGCPPTCHNGNSAAQAFSGGDCTVCGCSRTPQWGGTESPCSSHDHEPHQKKTIRTSRSHTHTRMHARTHARTHAR